MILLDWFLSLFGLERITKADWEKGALDRMADQVNPKCDECGHRFSDHEEAGGCDVCNCAKFEREAYYD